MYARCPVRRAVAGAVLAAGLTGAAPAAAAVTYDPATRRGVVGGADVRRAFGWSAGELDARAAGGVFRHASWVDDTYTADCGAGPFPLVHHRIFAWDQLRSSVFRGAGPGYGGPLGFRLTGPSMGVSGTTSPPTAGEDCPAGHGREPGSKIVRIAPVSSITGWSLSVAFGSGSRVLRQEETAGPLPAPA